MKSAITVWNCTCEKCGVNWTSRSEKIPKQCSSCKSVNWDKSSEKKIPEKPIVLPPVRNYQTAAQYLGNGKQMPIPEPIYEDEMIDTREIIPIDET